MTTILSDRDATDVPGARAEGERLWMSPGDLTRATGWELKPEGLCRGEVCVPVPAGGRGEALVKEGRVDVAALWRHLDRPLAHSDDGTVWSLGEGASERAAALRSLAAPDFALPDRDGRTHRLSDHRGKKVLLVSWASW
jgi:hypothetical protein